MGGPVAVLGGLLQIVLFMFLCGLTAAVLYIHQSFNFLSSMHITLFEKATHLEVILQRFQFCGAKSSEGVFVGAFLSMSSTAVVSMFIQGGQDGYHLTNY